MRITSVLAAVLVVGLVTYWFVLRHELSSDSAAAAVQETPSTQADATPSDAAQSDAANTGLAAAEETPVAVQVLDSVARDSDKILVVRGRTTAVRHVEVAAMVQGRMISDPRRRGSVVAAGDLLCRLDPATSEADLAEAEAALAEAEAEASAAEQLSSKGFTADTTLKARRAALRAAQARLDKVKWEIGQLEIRAPFDGVLETDTAELGTFLMAGHACATVIDMSQVKVEGFVSEEEIDLLQLGQAAGARLINGQRIAGEISFLSRVADPDTRTYAVEVTFDNPGMTIRDGMTAELGIRLDTIRAHLIPQSALTLNDDGQLGVRLVVDGRAKFRTVELVKEGAERGVWIAGLPEEASIIVVGQEFVRDGRAVSARPVEIR
ncbi:MAG: efflux RND transporter periplasmic adaptor subunit [Pseudomonadota bacterium]